MAGVLNSYPAENPTDGPETHDEEHQDALDELKFSTEYERDNITNGYDDLQFVAGNQWSLDDVRERTTNGKTSEVFDQTEEFVSQVHSDFRMNRCTIKCSSEGAGSNQEMRSLYEGIIRKILYNSKFEEITDRSSLHQLYCGFGYWKFGTRYTKWSAFAQEIYIEHIVNPLAVRWDPRVGDMNKEYANYCYILERIPTKEFKKEYPGKAAVSVPQNSNDNEGVDAGKWVIIAERWYREEFKRTIVKLNTGQELTKEKAEEVIAEAELSYNLQRLMNPMMPPMELPKIVDEAEITDHKVFKRLMSGADWLEEPQEFPCSIIPVVPIWGKEIYVNGRRILSGMIRKAKGPQRSYNYAKNEKLTMLGSMITSGFQATPTMVDGHEDQYETGNKKQNAIYYYEKDSDFPNMKPELIPHPEIPSAFLTTEISAREDIKAAMGMHDPAMGMTSRIERSAPSILAQQRIADENNYVYYDNLKRSHILSGEILLDMIPRVYDTQQMIRIKNFDDTEQEVPINSTAPNKWGLMTRVNDLSVGHYSITVTTGPSNTSARIEAQEFYLKLIGLDSQKLLPLLGWLVVKSADVPFVDEAYKAMKTLLPPALGGPQPDPNSPQGKAMMMQQQLSQIHLKTEEFKAMKVMYEVEKAKGKLSEGSLKNIAQALDMLETMITPQMQPGVGQAPPAQTLPQGIM